MSLLDTNLTQNSIGKHQLTRLDDLIQPHESNHMIF